MPLLSSGDLAQLSGLLASALESGQPLEPSIGILAAQAGSPRLRSALGQVAGALRDGQSLPEAFEKLSSYFSPEYGALLRSGLKGGRLPEVLRSAERYHSLRANLSRKSLRLGFYLLVGALLSEAVAVMALVVGQRMTEVYTTLGIKAEPEYTAVAWSSKFAWLVLAGVLAFFFLLALGFWALDRWRALAWLAHRLPVWGKLLKSRDLALFSTAMWVQTAAKTPLPEALSAAEGIVGAGRGRPAVGRLRRRVSEGEGLSTSLYYEPYFPRTLAWAVSLGEARGEIPATFQTFAELYEADLERNFEILIQSLTPLGLLGLGNAVFLAASAILVPLFGVQRALF